MGYGIKYRDTLIQSVIEPRRLSAALAGVDVLASLGIEWAEYCDSNPIAFVAQYGMTVVRVKMVEITDEADD